MAAGAGSAADMLLLLLPGSALSPPVHLNSVCGCRMWVSQSHASLYTYPHVHVKFVNERSGAEWQQEERMRENEGSSTHRLNAWQLKNKCKCAVVGL